MALLTVQRSQSLEGVLDTSSEEESGEENDDQYEDNIDSPGPRPPKLGRMRSPSFAGYFASKGGAVSLPDGSKARTPTHSHRKPCAELQSHLQTMITLLREEDSLKMAVRIESQLPDKKRYLTAVTNSNDECILVGIDWASGPTIGLVLELNKTTITKLDGDGGFHITFESGRTHCFKPVSVQTLWSAMHIIERGVAIAAKNCQGKSYTEFVSFYKSKIDSDATSISEWNMMDDLMSTRQFDLVTSDQEDSDQAAVKKIIRAKLKEVMIRVDIDEVTSREIRRMCEDELGMDLSEFKSFLDQEIFTILGQMDSASKIFDYLYLFRVEEIAICHQQGSEWNASDLEELQNLGVGHILNLTREIDNFFPETFVYYNVRVWDEEDTELLQYWERTFKFIHNAKMAGSNVLVHCRRGISRSASTVIAYIMKSRGWSLKETMEYVKKCRSIVDPNAGFQKQLIIYEGILNSSRNRYSALFRQRSKSDVLRSSLHDRRELFKKAKHSEEIDEEDQENNDDDFEKKNLNRPKSWTPDSSGMNFDSQVDPERFVSKTSTKSMEMPPLKEDEEDDNAGELQREIEVKKTAKVREGGEAEGVDGASKRAKQKRRILSRARTLPTQTPRHWEELVQKESKIDDSRPLTEAEETKQENLFEQAVAASMMKTQLLQSLVKLQESRGTKDFLDNQFSVESIIKPSTLRKASSSRRLPFERTRSFSEDKSPSPRHNMRERAFTVGPSKHFVSYGDDEDPFEDNENDSQATEEKVVKTDEVETEVQVSEPDNSIKSCENEPNESLAIETACSNDSGINVIETSQFQTVKESAKRYEEQEMLRAQRIRILRSPRRHTIGCSKVWEKVIKEASSSFRSKSSEGRVANRNESPSPETIGRSRKERKTADLDGKQLFTVVNTGDGGKLDQSDESQSAADSKQKITDEDDLSVRKLVEKHSELIRHSSPPGNSDSTLSFFDSNSVVASIGENLISACVATDDKSDCETSGVGRTNVNADDNNQEGNEQDLKNDSVLKPTDVVQPGLVKRQSKLFSMLDCDKGPQSPEAVRNEPIGSDFTENTDPADKENAEPSEEEEKEHFQRSKRGSVKELLRQMEGKTGMKAQRPASLNVQKRDKELDTEVAFFMLSPDTRSTEQEVSQPGLQTDLQTELQVLQKDSQKDPQEDPQNDTQKDPQNDTQKDPQNDTQKDLEAFLLKPQNSASRAKSAPVSPSLPRQEPMRPVRSSSVGDATQFDALARHSNDVFLTVLPSEAPTEDVKSLVDRFEIGNLP